MSYNFATKRFDQNPQLIHRRRNPLEVRHFLREEHWALNTTTEDRDSTYMLKIRVYWDGEKWDHFEFVATNYSLGEPVLLVTADEFNERVQAIRENEGDEAAKKWCDEQDETRVAAAWELEMRDALIRRYRAMAELIALHVTF